MIWNSIVLAEREIRRNVLRSALTVLGVVIGVAAVITLVTLGKGATAQVTTQVSSLGSNLLHVRPGQGRHGPGGSTDTSAPFEVEDAQAILREVSGIAAVAPVESKNMQAIYGNENWSTTVTGSNGSYIQTRNLKLREGRNFSESELRAGKAVCILGNTVREKLFAKQTAMGVTIRLQGVACEVIGLFESKGQSAFGSDQDDFVLVPLRMLQRRITGSTEINAIMISAQNGVSTDKVRRDVEDLMRERRRIAEGQDDDFHVRDMQELVSALTGTTQVLTALLGAVAAVSLLVGGIGIMNVMLVSVTERTREIGIRTAVGAREREVLTQFLVEAVVLSSCGGLLGVIVGLGGAGLGSHLLSVPFVFDAKIALIAFLFSGAVGVVFGFFPARRAARFNPIDALRHE